MLVAKRIHRIAVPRFGTQQEEAAWFEEHRRDQAVNMRRRFAAGEGKTLAQAIAQSAAKEKVKLKPVTIRMLPDDLELVRRLAFDKGLPYQTFIKVLLREALVRETKRLTR